MPYSAPMSDVWSLLESLAAGSPRATALIHGAERLDFATLRERALAAARGLAALGVGPGDRVALWLPNIPAYPVLYFACARLGAIAVAVNTRYRAGEVADIVHRSGARVLACAPAFRRIDFLSILAEIDPAALDGLAAIVTVGDETAAPPALAARRRVTYERLLEGTGTAPLGAGPDAPCNIFTTSGTTSRPKFVFHAQAGIARHAHDVARRFALDAPETLTLSVLPLCGVFGFNQAMATLAAGRPVVLVESFDVDELARLIAEHHPTWLAGSDDMYARLLDAAPGARPFPSLRFAIYAAFNNELADIADRAQARGLALCGVYGMSEVQALYARRDPALPLGARKASGGSLTAPDAAVRVRDPETGTPLGPGEAGALECAGPSRMRGYWGDEAATRAALTDDGYVRTGDLAALDGDGGFTFLNRMGDVLRLGGFLVNPLEIEQHLQSLPGIAACQTVAVARPGGTRAVSFVVLAPGATFDEASAIAHCRRTLASYKTPLRVVAVEAFPTTPSPNGVKIQRARLREMAERLF
ncbi:MAG: AMP-binding protein [Alphaproteobacteria bacterium]|nr:AMP-binding protein [Alphaproteobacteria bacterium]